VVVVDKSVYWTLISYRQMFWKFLKRGKLLLQLDDVAGWGWASSPSSTQVEAINQANLDSVTYGVCDTFQVLPWEIDQVESTDLSRVKESYRADFNRYYAALAELQKRVRLEKVMYAQGYVSGADACRQFSLRTGIKRFAIENVADKRKILWENVSGIAVNKTLARNFYEGFKGFFSEAVIRQHLTKKLTGIRESKTDEHKAGSAKTSESGYILFLGQVYTDTSILFSVKAGWGPIDVLRALADSVPQLDHDLIVKLHPKEWTGKSSLARMPYNSLTYRKMKEVPGLLETCKLVDH